MARLCQIGRLFEQFVRRVPVHFLIPTASVYIILAFLAHSRDRVFRATECVLEIVICDLGAGTGYTQSTHHAVSGDGVYGEGGFREVGRERHDVDYTVAHMDKSTKSTQIYRMLQNNIGWPKTATMAGQKLSSPP